MPVRVVAVSVYEPTCGMVSIEDEQSHVLAYSASSDDADELRRLTILGPWESDPEAGLISYESETAKRLLDSRVGDDFEDSGAVWTIESIEGYSV